MIRCGHCREAHQTVEQVKACGQIKVPGKPKPTQDPTKGTWMEGLTPAQVQATLDANQRDMDRMDAENERRQERAAYEGKMRRDEAILCEPPFSFTTLAERVLDLLDERVVEPRYSMALYTMVEKGPTVTLHGLKMAVERLEACAFKPGRAPAPKGTPAATPAPAQVRKPVEHEGLYRLSRDAKCAYGVVVPEGQLVQVVRGKDSGQLYAKTIHFTEGQKRPNLVYVKGLIFELLESELLPAEEAQDLTRRTGWCVFGHFLTNPKSIARGMGPTCYERYPHLALDAA